MTSRFSVTPQVALIIAVIMPAVVHAQEARSVGAGSYAATPPVGLVMDGKRKVDLVAETEARPVFLVHDDGRPLPTNKWFQNVVYNQYGTGLWAMPHKVDATAEGIEVFHANTFDAGGTRSLAEFPLVIAAEGFKPVDSRAKNWTDWTVAFRMFESDQRYFDVTLGEGMPFVWCEFVGTKPLIALGGKGGKGSRGKTAVTFFDRAGAAVALPQTGDTIGLTYEGRHYGVFAPDGTTFAQTPAGIAVTFAGSASFLVIAPLPAAKDLAAFQRYAFAVPRDTKLSWNYDRAAGTIATTWTVTAEPLKGTSKEVLQGFLPHHWRDNSSPLAFADVAYTTIRGKMKCAAGTSFTLKHDFRGVLPNLPKTEGNAVDAGRLKPIFADHFASPRTQLGTDTYWGGKSLQQYAQAAFVAKQVADPSADAILVKLRSTFENWLTFTPGERDRFFAYYPRRKGLVGFNVAYGSQHFTDHHFHHGYFATAGAMLCQMQPDFAEKFGPMLQLVARSYANYDRSDTRFPFFRTFDLWRGHSFADGKGFPDGNNQESTGEAVNSWVGLILLGEALGDAEMTAAGVMGYTFETRANLEYWFDPHGDVFPPAYPHNACGMIWCNSIVWGTWFTASPAWIYGIQWIPSGPFASFYDRDRSFIAKAHADAMRELDAFETREAAKKPGAKKKDATIKALGGELASYHLGFLMHADAADVVAQIDQLHAEPGDKVARDPWMANVYYQASALKHLGRVDWTCHTDSPTAMVYVNEATGVRTYVAWNPSGVEKTVEFFEKGKSVGKATVGPRRCVATIFLRL